MARREEEDQLINLMRAEDEAERIRAATEALKAKRLAMHHEMLAANEEQKRIKVETYFASWPVWIPPMSRRTIAATPYSNENLRRTCKPLKRSDVRPSNTAREHRLAAQAWE